MRNTPNKATTPTGIEPVEGRPDMDLPGADYPEPANDPGADLPARLGRRIEEGPGEGIATGETDLLPDVEVPAGQM